ncbi:MAG: DNA/RNA nuclease SfsA [Bacteroidota bacterium]
MRLPEPLIRGTLLKRSRAFLAEARLADGRCVTVHCPNPGPLTGCAEPGSKVVLSVSRDPARRHPFTWQLTEAGASWVCVNSPFCRRVLAEAVESRAVAGIPPFLAAERDADCGLRHRVDVLLHAEERNSAVSFFHVTRSDAGTALFPDGPAPKAALLLRRLADFARGGHQAVALFFVQRGDCRMLRLDEKADRDLVRAVVAAHGSGVEFPAYGAEITPESVALGSPVRFHGP